MRSDLRGIGQRVLDFYARGLIHPTYSTRPLEDVNAVLDTARPAWAR